jgi:hypothetical protein
VLLHPVRQSDAALLSQQRLFHHPDAHALAAIGTAVRSAFGGFVGLWLVSFVGAVAVVSLYPALMEHAFGVVPDRSPAALGWSSGVGAGLAWSYAARPATMKSGCRTERRERRTTT